MIRRPPRSTLSSSSAASDVYKRQGIVIPPTPTQTFTIVETPTMPRSHTVSVSAASNTPSHSYTLSHEPLLTMTAPLKDRTDSQSLLSTSSTTTTYSSDPTITASLVVSDDTTTVLHLSLIHISEPTRLLSISYAVFCLKKKNITQTRSI
eukprot:TRINITY_DN34073_c0_g1_i1.p1 TRINITY_DN34073_c0_g1~~TRINITY_DN34073_c0_g1_i1.p1  ORF type:complete len:150 (+),score=23.40 TRINITY_DN34073_c0_g1_i1:97-546(+)